MENSNYKTEIIKDQNTKNDLFAKVEVVGDLEVGKTSILKKITQNEFSEEYTPTLGYEFNPYLIKVNDIILKLQIWDMCGNENYRSVLLNLYRNATLGILVYSVCSRESFNNLENWISQLKKHSLPGSKIILLGNKYDIGENNSNEIQITKNQVLKFFSQTDNFFYNEISCKTNFGVDKIRKVIEDLDVDNGDDEDDNGVMEEEERKKRVKETDKSCFII